jgi:coenzyme PQQ precursor peptide PqqA
LREPTEGRRALAHPFQKYPAENALGRPFCGAIRAIPARGREDFTSEVFRARYLAGQGGRSSGQIVPVNKVRSTRRAKMAWKAPKIVEVPVGMEINMYACAARK